MDRCLLDTSALSDVIQPMAKRLPTVARHLKQYLRAHGRITLSEISCYEVLRGLRKKTAPRQEQEFLRFCRHSELLPVSYDILDKAAFLWAEGQRLGVIIAATAIRHDIRLVTANTHHFEWIRGIDIENWRT